MKITTSLKKKKLVAVIHNGNIYFRYSGTEDLETIKIEASSNKGYKTFIALEKILLDRPDAKPIYEGDKITLKF